MGLALAIVLGFLGVIGVHHQQAVVVHKQIKPAKQSQMPIEKKVIKKAKAPSKNTIALLDGIPVRNLKG
tara:strand:+ start:43 stop:249 length:207 start_codon:yes stop_codon:yes gene_type:complete